MKTPFGECQRCWVVDSRHTESTDDNWRLCERCRDLIYSESSLMDGLVFDLPSRAINALTWIGIMSPEHLQALDPSHVKRIENIGPKTAALIIEAIHGLRSRKHYSGSPLVIPADDWVTAA